MQALNIKDLSATTELDAKAMSAVRGGMGYSSGLTPFAMPSFGSLSLSASEFNVGAVQSLGQSQNTLVNNGNNAAFVSGITSCVNPTQNGSNNIHIG
ncbi:hypothetical protein [Noviherbaspirillum galbum]|uniref:Uncharacterized protein n=1 Tax=Noviherbaspirillum galbum TaxID=2709383 RepID=A0A6B3SPM7_9BURK|nr:hypothetical protein [Noviherbaspirillum galbum]NEX62784.1 hypothetical protein [Noviherbaspirillum galbum]